ncbi:pseudouridine synthase [Rhodocytophaga aerolata]|uniref:Pseudouridine synthase n=2 Tax=Rhodocytophaga aerolata TaxID=455078 RepID=A0ABT8R554_9BACT|nr:pseudouridine synthase [Rhodocytophaga aerolata]
MYKPFGYLSQFIGEGNKKKRLGELYAFPPGTMSIGRLDEKSEGLLLLTTDGKLSNYISSAGIEKEYYVQVDGLISQQAMEQLEQGIEITLEGIKYQTKPCKACLLEPAPELPLRSRKIRDDRHGPTSWMAITLTEGKFRQIRKMTAALGFPTLRLIRMRIGHIHLMNLLPGEVLKVEGLLNRL